MPKYFKSKAEQLLAESFASLLIIESLCANSVIGGTLPDKLVHIYCMAQNRHARRINLFNNSIK